MLLGGKQRHVKQVAIVTRNLEFNKLLSSILADWRFFVVENLSVAEVILAERGIELPALEGQVVWLTPMPLLEGTFLQTPISLSCLYNLLEGHLFPTPRRHIRVFMEADVDLRINNKWVDGRLVSLSDRGGRFLCDHEMPRGKSLDIAMKLAGKNLMIQAEVLYCIPAGDFAGRPQPQIGVLFKSPDNNKFAMLRHYIEKICIERACAREDIPLNDPCVSWFEVPSVPCTL